MESRTEINDLSVDNNFYRFIFDEVLPGTGIENQIFWLGFEKILKNLVEQNSKLLYRRNILQKKMGEWHENNNKQFFNKDEYFNFLRSIGYIEEEPESVKISTDNVDPEISNISAPQLVVPGSNARYVLNAANARWGSLYDALYGSDVIPLEGKTIPTKVYNEARGAAVIAFGRNFLDEIIPLKDGSHKEALGYSIKNGSLKVWFKKKPTGLANINQFVGYSGKESSPDSLLFKNHNLHFELQLDKKSSIGKNDKAGISDIILEAAVTTIFDCEDSVAAVDAEDKITVYRNWLGLMKRDLKVSFKKENDLISRELNKNRVYNNIQGKFFSLSGTSLLFNRNVGHLMKTDTVLHQGIPIPEGILDAVVTALIGLHDLKQTDTHNGINSKARSIYIVKPKMHGSKEVEFTMSMFDMVEDLLNLPRNTIKIGIMDEERRTTFNLKACIAMASKRIVFINTGFLDRTGDEIHTIMQAGAVIPKNNMKNAHWLKAYENWNVDIGLECGFKNKAQIGKGMWAMPDRMAEMLDSKRAHPEAGANTAWVPSPSAATLHAIHYHQIDVDKQQSDLAGNRRSQILDLLEIPVALNSFDNPSEIQKELDNNIQSILGYVVRWIDQGVGCSKVPDINNVGLMEDRATLRISSQHIANWLYHGVVTKDQIERTLKKQAQIVDTQNSEDDLYQPMSLKLQTSLAFGAAKELIFNGISEPNGYTEPVLHRIRREKKMSL